MVCFSNNLGETIRFQVSEALEGEKVKKLQTVVNAKKNKIRRYKLVPINRGTGKGVGQKGALALAAVGAGMIPATMAILLPMALGRSKRSLTEFNSEIRDKYFLKKL